jgi:hypothetical protein
VSPLHRRDFLFLLNGWSRLTRLRTRGFEEIDDLLARRGFAQPWKNPRDGHGTRRPVTGRPGA